MKLVDMIWVCQMGQVCQKRIGLEGNLVQLGKKAVVGLNVNELVRWSCLIRVEFVIEINLADEYI